VGGGGACAGSEAAQCSAAAGHGAAAHGSGSARAGSACPRALTGGAGRAIGAGRAGRPGDACGSDGGIAGRRLDAAQGRQRGGAAGCKAALPALHAAPVATMRRTCAGARGAGRARLALWAGGAGGACGRGGKGAERGTGGVLCCRKRVPRPAWARACCRPPPLPSAPVGPVTAVLEGVLPLLAVSRACTRAQA
jgi:hypothetical protein